MFNTLRTIIDKAEKACDSDRIKRIAQAAIREAEQVRYERAQEFVAQYEAKKK